MVASSESTRKNCGKAPDYISRCPEHLGENLAVWNEEQRRFLCAIRARLFPYALPYQTYQGSRYRRNKERIEAPAGFAYKLRHNVISAQSVVSTQPLWFENSFTTVCGMFLDNSAKKTPWHAVDICLLFPTSGTKTALRLETLDALLPNQIEGKIQDEPLLWFQDMGFQ